MAANDPWGPDTGYAVSGDGSMVQVPLATNQPQAPGAGPNAAPLPTVPAPAPSPKLPSQTDSTSKAAAAGKPAPGANASGQIPDDLSSYLSSALGDFADANMLSDDGKTRINATDLAASIYKRPADEINRIQGMLFRGGYYTNGTKWGDVAKGQVDDGTLAAWATMLKQTAAQGSANPDKNWKNVLTDMANTHQNGTGPTSKTDISTGTTDDTKNTNETENAHQVSTANDFTQANTVEHHHTESTQSAVKFSDPVTAHALVVKAMQDKLGRDPTDGELSTFRGALHQYEAANPTVTKTVGDQTTTTHEATATSKTAITDTTTNTQESARTKGSQTQKTTTTTPGQGDDNTIPSTLGSTAFPSGGAPSTAGDMGLGAAFSGLKALPDSQVKSGNFQGATNGTTTTPGTTTDQANTSNSNTDTNRNVNQNQRETSNQTSNTTRDVNDISSQNSTQSGGTDPADWAQFYVQEQNRPEMDEYHKGTMYYNAALNVLGLGGSHG